MRFEVSINCNTHVLTIATQALSLSCSLATNLIVGSLSPLHPKSNSHGSLSLPPRDPAAVGLSFSKSSSCRSLSLPPKFHSSCGSQLLLSLRQLLEISY